jgi:hypothetical protein
VDKRTAYKLGRFLDGSGYWRRIASTNTLRRFQTSKSMPAPSNATANNPKTKTVIRFTQSLQLDVFNRLSKAKKDKGLSFEQDVVRLAVIQFLERNGY